MLIFWKNLEVGLTVIVILQYKNRKVDKQKVWRKMVVENFNLIWTFSMGQLLI